MVEEKPITRAELEEKARAYLERSRDVRNRRAGHKPIVTGTEFERLVQRTVAQTVRQLRAIGRDVVD